MLAIGLIETQKELIKNIFFVPFYTKSETRGGGNLQINQT